MSEKALINSVELCVPQCLYGFSKLHSNLKFYREINVAVNANAVGSKNVVVISGGGSGHEPFPTGYVGDGMLSASVSGAIFTSPPSTHILQAIRVTTKCSKDVVLVVPNYTGDVLNFGLAAEIATNEGINVECVVVGEDIAQETHGIQNKAGRRGMCGIILILKIAGFLSSRGRSLPDMKKVLEEVVKSMASLGLCLAPCSKPGVGFLFHLEKDEVELGLGVHGEAGVARFKLLSAEEAVKMILGLILNYLKVKSGDKVVAMINNLGSLSYIEQWLLAGEVEKQLHDKNIKVLRIYADHFFTSLNMAGVQICILKLNPNNEDLILEALDHPTSAFSWSATSRKNPSTWELNTTSDSFCNSVKNLLPPDMKILLKKCLTNIGNDLIKAENHLNYLDSVCGDGDCGNTFVAIAKGLKTKAEALVPGDVDPAVVFFELSLEMQSSVGGTSGALYGLFFKGVSDELKSYKGSYDGLCVSKCWRAGIERIKKYSTARVGDRTMLDSLETACEVFEKEINENAEKVLESFQKAVASSVEGCRKTISMKASAGRASYTNQTQAKEDAGAYAVTVWLSAILKMESDVEDRVAQLVRAAVGVQETGVRGLVGLSSFTTAQKNLSVDSPSAIGCTKSLDGTLVQRVY